MKKILTIAVILTMTATTNLTAHAAGWQQDSIGYWYQNDNGTWPSSTWQWIDGNNDGKAECYYFDKDGYMLFNSITPDGYLVNSDGAWVENGVVQIQNVPLIAIDFSNTTNNETDNMTETERFARKVCEIVNQERQADGKTSLEWNDNLSTCASIRAQELAETFSHSRTDGSSCFTIYQEYGVSFRAAGENIAMGQSTPENVMNSWMNSPGHKANILNSSFGKIGVGCYYTNGKYYWVQMFTD